MSDYAPGGASQEFTYDYKPSVVGAGWFFRLTNTGIAFEAGRRNGFVAYRDITSVRMSFRPATMQSYRFMTQIHSRNAPTLTIVSTSWRGMVEQRADSGPYTAFITEMHRRMAAADAQPRFEAGTNPLLYWPGLVVFVLICVALAFLFVRAVAAQIGLGAAFIAAFLALFMWGSGNYFRRNRPGTYRPDKLPSALLPIA